MKKTLLAVIAMLSVLPFISQAQYLPLSAGTSSPLTGVLLTNVYNANQVALNNNGNNYGFISNPSPNKWSLGYGTTPSTLATSVLTWNDSGNVGIGMTNPSYKLDILKAGSGSGLNITGIATGTRNDTGIDFSGINATTVNYARIGLQISDGSTGHETGGLTFSTINNSTFSEKMFISANGYVGIGTTNPTLANLVVYGNQGMAIDGSNAASQLTFYNSGTILGSIGKGNYAVTGADQTGVSVYSQGAMSFATAGQAERMRISSSGKVGIGTITPDELLSVKGVIHGQAVKVDMTGWSDYVFKPAYKLPTLASVKVYIDKNQHLPEIPSEQEITKNGLDLGEMNKLLMKKVEELTLYLIEKDQQVDDQKKQLAQQEARLKQIEQQLKGLISKK